MPSNTVHTRFAASAVRQIDKHGRAMVLRVPSKSGPDYNPVLTWADVPIVGLVIDYQVSEVDGDQIRLDDKQILVAASTVVIDNTMRVLDGAIEYSIKRANLLQPGNTPILYTLQVRI